MSGEKQQTRIRILETQSDRARWQLLSLSATFSDGRVVRFTRVIPLRTSYLLHASLARFGLYLLAFPVFLKRPNVFARLL